MLTILHTNDLHGCVEMLPRLSALIRRERRQDPEALLVDTGDSALSGLTADLGVRLLSSLGYAAMTPGNSENDVPEHRRNLSRVGSPVVVANVAPDAFGSKTMPYLLREVRGVTIALLGLTVAPPYPPGHRLHRAKIQQVREVPVLDASEAARRWVPTLRAQANLVVVLSHLGLRRDVQLAQDVPGIDLIIGAHSHHRLPCLLHIGDTAIAQAGVNGAYLGVVTAAVGAGRLVLTGRLEPLWQDAAEDEDAAQAVAQELRRAWPQGAEAVGSTGGCWADPWQQNPWSDFVTDTLRRAAGADICFYNAGALLPALSPGPVTRWDLRRCLPGKRADETMGLGGLRRLVLTGEDVRAICEHSVRDLPRDVGPQVPAGFCLPSNPLLHASGIRVVYDLTRAAGERVRHLRIDGQAVEPSRLYRIATSDFLSRGYSGYHWFRQARERQEVGPEIPLLLEGLQQERGLPPADGRLQFQES